jgi:hypothetical protein
VPVDDLTRVAALILARLSLQVTRRFKIHGCRAGAVDAAQKAFIEARFERIDMG